MIKLDFNQFRKDYKLPAAEARIICKELGYKVVREGTEQYIIGSNSYNVDDEYYLKHGVLEYRATLYVSNTKAGNFFEYKVELEEGTAHIGVSQFNNDAVKPILSGVRREPNETPKSILVPVDKGAELMKRHIQQVAAPPERAQMEQQPPTDALSILVNALRQAQASPEPQETLHPQKTLLEAEQQGFYITTEQLGHLLGMSKGTISSKKSGFRKLGFEFTKIKESSATLWKVNRYNT